MHIQNPALKTKHSGKQGLGGVLEVLTALGAPLNILAIVHFAVCPDGPAGELRRV